MKVDLEPASPPAQPRGRQIAIALFVSVIMMSGFTGGSGIVQTTMAAAAEVVTMAVPELAVTPPVPEVPLASPCQAILNGSEYFSLDHHPRHDLASGRMDSDVCQLLAQIPIAVPCSSKLNISSMHSGRRSRHTRTGSVSEHMYYRAADISWVGGQRVNAGNGCAREVVQWLKTQNPGNRFQRIQIGMPFRDLETGSRESPINVFYDSGHKDHLHFGIKK